MWPGWSQWISIKSTPILFWKPQVMEKCSVKNVMYGQRKLYSYTFAWCVGGSKLGRLSSCCTVCTSGEVPLADLLRPIAVKTVRRKPRAVRTISETLSKDMSTRLKDERSIIISEIPSLAMLGQQFVYSDPLI